VFNGGGWSMSPSAEVCPTACGWQRLVTGGRGHVTGMRAPTDLHQAAEFIGFARGEDDDALRISTKPGSDAGSPLNGAKSGGVDTPPVMEQERRLRVGVGHPRGSFEPEVPLAVREVEEQRIGSRHLQMVIRDQAGVTRRPDCAVRRFDPEPARVLRLKHAIARPRRRVLPRVVGRVSSTRTGPMSSASPIAWP
jgi:hypothetical protein